MTRNERLRRLEALETTAQLPTHIEYHDCIPVGPNDARRGAVVIEQGNRITFHCATAAEYLAASSAYAGERRVIVISLDHRCIDFEQQEGTRQ